MKFIKNSTHHISKINIFLRAFDIGKLEFSKYYFNGDKIG